MFIPSKVLAYLDSKIFYSITDLNLLTVYSKVKMLTLGSLINWGGSSNKRGGGIETLGKIE